jgi:hypothetical protein
MDRVHGGPHSGPRWTTLGMDTRCGGAWRVSARAYQSSSAVVEGDKVDEVVPEGRSPEDERQRLKLVTRAEEGERELESEGVPLGV